MGTRTSIAVTAFETLRSNPLHTLMSITGLVIGVAALVGVLSLGDGMERFAREQIDETTDLKMISVSAHATERIDGISVERTRVAALSVGHGRSLQNALGDSATVVYYVRKPAIIATPDDTVRTATHLAGTSESATKLMRGRLLAGRGLTSDDLDTGRGVAVISSEVAARLAPGDSLDGFKSLIGRSIIVDSLVVNVVGTVESHRSDPFGILVPATLPGAVSGDNRPVLAIKANSVEDVPDLRERIRAWADDTFPGGADDIAIASNEMRVDQAQRAVRLFKVIMGLITGIAVVVGGIGVMNVLLMAVTERTREIGVRMATGARRKDIVYQFMIESVAISSAGAISGLLVGLIAVFIFTPIIRRLTDVPFQAGFSISTLLIVLVLAAAVGILFGTYPAWRASRLNPIDALRYE